VYIDTPGGSEGGIWQGGNGIAADFANAIYFVSGNGTFDANAGGLDYGDSTIKLSAAALTQKRVLRPTDYFTPYNQRHLSTQDLDMGTAGAVLLPDQAVGPAHLLVTTDKAGTVYLIDRDHMGHFSRRWGYPDRSGTAEFPRRDLYSAGGLQQPPLYELLQHSGVRDSDR